MVYNILNVIVRLVGDFNMMSDTIITIKMVQRLADLNIDFGLYLQTFMDSYQKVLGSEPQTTQKIKESSDDNEPPVEESVEKPFLNTIPLSILLFAAVLILRIVAFLHFEWVKRRGQALLFEYTLLFLEQKVYLMAFSSLFMDLSYYSMRNIFFRTARIPNLYWDQLNNLAAFLIFATVLWDFMRRVSRIYRLTLDKYLMGFHQKFYFNLKPVKPTQIVGKKVIMTRNVIQKRFSHKAKIDDSPSTDQKDGQKFK